jgi:magnesium transporter
MRQLHRIAGGNPRLHHDLVAANDQETSDLADHSFSLGNVDCDRMGHFEGEIEKAVVLAVFLPLIISSGGNSGSQATTLIIRAMAVGEVRLRDWWRVLCREVGSGASLGIILGAIGFCRIMLWQSLHFQNYGIHYFLVALAVGLSLIGVVLWGCVSGSMLPFLLRRCGLDPATSSAPFVATLVDVTGLVIYFNVALLILRGSVL